MYDCNSFSLFSRRLWVIVQCSRLSAEYLSRFLPWSSRWVIGLDERSRKCKADLSLIFKLILCEPRCEIGHYEILNRLVGVVRDWCQCFPENYIHTWFKLEKVFMRLKNCWITGTQQEQELFNWRWVCLAEYFNWMIFRLCLIIN